MADNAGRVSSTVQSHNEFIILPFRILDKLLSPFLAQEKISLLKSLAPSYLMCDMELEECKNMTGQC